MLDLFFGPTDVSKLPHLTTRLISDKRVIKYLNVNYFLKNEHSLEGGRSTCFLTSALPFSLNPDSCFLDSLISGSVSPLYWSTIGRYVSDRMQKFCRYFCFSICFRILLYALYTPSLANMYDRLFFTV